MKNYFSHWNLTNIAIQNSNRVIRNHSEYSEDDVSLKGVIISVVLVSIILIAIILCNKLIFTTDENSSKKIGVVECISTSSDNGEYSEVIQYEDLIEGQEYTLQGVLLNKNGEKISEIQTITFTPDKGDGEVEIKPIILNKNIPEGSYIWYNELKVNYKE